MTDPIVIVGASHAGVQAAASLRQAGWQHGIIVYSAENTLPYHRPPLSKAFLAGEKELDQILLRGEAFYTDQNIDLRLNDPVLSIDPTSHTVEADSGEQRYSKLIIATGSKARALKIDGYDLPQIHTLRSISDVLQLKSAMLKAQNIAVIGGGFIGLEFASTAAKLGKNVTVFETREKLLMRALPADIGDFLQSYHENHGVRFRFGAQLTAFESVDGKLTAISLADGTKTPADMALVGIGGEADLALLQPLGLEMAAGGIEVDEHGCTSIADIYAIGDVASYRNFLSNEPMRLESVHNAVDQARAAAAHIAGQHAPFVSVPWFWTDQYDLKVQMAGLARSDAIEITRGDKTANSFTILHVIEDRLVASFSINRAADHMASRRLIADRTLLDLEAVADASIPLLKTAKTS